MRPRRDLTEGSILGALLALAGPIVAANALQIAYQLTDMYWVGQISAEAVAAVSLSFPVNFLVISLGGGLGISGTVLVAQYYGSGQRTMVNHVARQTILLMLSIALGLAIGGRIIAEPLMRLMGAGPDVLPDASDYIGVLFLGLPMFFGFFVYQSLMRGVGYVGVPMFVVLGSVLLNFALDPLFIFGYGSFPAFGVKGAAMVTVITQGASALVGAALLLSGRFGIDVRDGRWRPDWALLRRILALGVPACVEQSSRAMGLLVMTFLVTSFDTAALASYGLGMRILSFVIIPALGLSMATSTIVGQNIGAGKRDRAERSSRVAIGVAFGSLSVAGVIFFVAAEPIARFFVPVDEAVIAQSAHFVRILSLTFGFIGVQQTISGTFRGSGNTFDAMVLTIISLWVLQFPLAYILSHHTPLGPDGIWWALATANLVSATIAVLWYLRGSWRRTRLIGEDARAEEMNREVIQETIIEESMP